MKRTIFILVGLLLAPASAFADDYEDGIEAYDRGEYATAVSKFRKAAEQGDSPAQYNLGVMYAGGEGVPKNYKQAVYWYTHAARQGNVDAQYNLGSMYGNGEGVPKDYVEAYKWLSLAAAQYDEDARMSLDLLEYQMTPEQIAEAQRLSREWKPR